MLSIELKGTVHPKQILLLFNRPHVVWTSQYVPCKLTQLQLCKFLYSHSFIPH